VVSGGVPVWGGKPWQPDFEAGEVCGSCSNCIRYAEAQRVIARSFAGGGGGEIVSSKPGPDCSRLKSYRQGQADAMERVAREAALERTA
jgi:hypothetical protein